MTILAPLSVEPRKTTPRLFAQDTIMDALSNIRRDWAEYHSAGMTQREIDQVDDQMKKECDRIAKRFGYTRSWI